MMYWLLCLIIVALIVIFIVHYSLDKKKIYKDLTNRVVVITGGSSGIGKSTAIQAVKLGAHVTIIGRNEEKLKAAVKEITAFCIHTNQKVEYSVLDVTTDYNNIQKAFSAIEAQMGPIFMLVNCAGMCICGQFENMKPEDIKYMVDLNYLGTAYPTKYVLPGMKERNEGIIVMVSSEAALIGIYGYSAYSAGKWAVRGLAEAVNMELVGTGVRLTLSFPADTDTPGLKEEELTKPEETKLISGSGGLHSPDVVAKKMLQDALVGNVYSVYSMSGNLLSLLSGGSINSGTQVLVQVLSMGFLRLIFSAVLISFHKIVRDKLKVKQVEKAGSRKIE